MCMRISRPMTLTKSTLQTHETEAHFKPIVHPQDLQDLVDVTLPETLDQYVDVFTLDCLHLISCLLDMLAMESFQMHHC
jgi:hypothetical protein